MPNCAVNDCDHRKTEKGQYQSFLLPTDPDLRRKWLKKINRLTLTPTDSTAVCKRHFTEEDFEPIQRNKWNRIPKRRKLKEGAVPTLFMGPEPEPNVPETRRSLENITTENDNLKKEVKDLKSKMQSKNETIENLKKRIVELEKIATIKEKKNQNKNDETEVELSAITSSLKKIFTEDQIKRLKYPDKRIAKWSEASIRQCITLYLICGCSAYKFMVAKGFPFVSIRTLQRHMAMINFDSGILDDIFILMKYKLEGVPKHHRNFGLVMDEMSLQAKLEFDIASQSFIGRPTVPLNPKTVVTKKLKIPEFDENKTLATHSMNFMICGLGKRFKQIVAWFLTYSSFDPEAVVNIMKTIVRKCHEIEINVVAITTDMSGQNQKI